MDYYLYFFENNFLLNKINPFEFLIFLDILSNKAFKYLVCPSSIKKLDKVFQVIIKSAIFEFLYKPKISSKIIINEYLKASNFFIEDGQTKYLNALLDKISKKIRNSNG